MRVLIFLTFSVFLVLPAFGQQAFTGKLVYQAELRYPDTTAVMRKWYVTLYTNDTIVRTETTGTQFGDQVYIRHMELNKAYLLLNIDGDKYAIQNDLSKRKDSLSDKYQFKKMNGRLKIEGIKAIRYRVVYKELPDKPFYIWVAKKIKGKYIEAYPGLDHLPLIYSIPTEDGVEEYQLIKAEPGLPDRNLFGLPTDYQKISFDEFMQIFTEGRGK